MPGTNLPRTLRKLVATQFSPKFRDVVAIAEDPMPQPGDGEILIKNRQVKKKLCKKSKLSILIYIPVLQNEVRGM